MAKDGYHWGQKPRNWQPAPPPPPPGPEPVRCGNRLAAPWEITVLERAYAARLTQDLELLAGVLTSDRPEWQPLSGRPETILPTIGWRL
jgi:hypothetical protein